MPAIDRKPASHNVTGPSTTFSSSCRTGTASQRALMLAKASLRGSGKPLDMPSALEVAPTRRQWHCGSSPDWPIRMRGHSIGVRQLVRSFTRSPAALRCAALRGLLVGSLSSSHTSLTPFSTSLPSPLHYQAFLHPTDTPYLLLPSASCSCLAPLSWLVRNSVFWLAAPILSHLPGCCICSRILGPFGRSDSTGSLFGRPGHPVIAWAGYVP